MDNLGAIGGPLLAIGLVALVGTRSAMLVSVIPGLLAAVAILYAIRATRRRDRAGAAAAPHPRPARPAGTARPPLLRHLRVRVGNVAATLLILRATQLLTPAHGHDARRQDRARPLHGYNLAAALASIPGGHLGDRRGTLLVLAARRRLLRRRLPRLRAHRRAPIALLALFFVARRASRSASSRRPSTPPSPRSPPPTSAAPRSARSRRSSRSATSPPARSPGCSGRLSPRAPPSSTSPRGCWCRWRRSSPHGTSGAQRCSGCEASVNSRNSAVSRYADLLADVDRVVADPLQRPRDDHHPQHPLAQARLADDLDHALDEAAVRAVDQLVEVDERLGAPRGRGSRTRRARRGSSPPRARPSPAGSAAASGHPRRPRRASSAWRS